VGGVGGGKKCKGRKRGSEKPRREMNAHTYAEGTFQLPFLLFGHGETHAEEKGRENSKLQGEVA